MMKLDLAAPPIEFIRDRLRYEPDTGHFYMLRSAGRRKVGARAGYPDRLGYWKVAINGKWIMAHRLAWRMVHGEWPLYEIDHINGDPSDNRIENLRVATRSQNVMNTRRGNGVCWHKRQKKWQVVVKANGKSHYLGLYIERADADRVAAEAIRRLHGKFANIAPPAKPTQEVLL